MGENSVSVLTPAVLRTPALLSVTVAGGLGAIAHLVEASWVLFVAAGIAASLGAAGTS